MRKPCWPGLALLFVGLTACGIPHEAVGNRDSVVETRRLDPRGSFRLQNVNGEVSVDTWDKAEVRIEAEKVAPRTRLDRIRIEIRGEGDRVTVETRMPRGGWVFGGGGKVDYRVTVPRRASVEVSTTNGRVRVAGSAGDLDARATNGGVDLHDCAGSVEASTTNGGVSVQFAEAPTGGSHRLSTTNGGVTLVLPSDASGEFEASTVNGGIHSDFPLEVEGRFGGRRLRGRIGDGEARFELRAVNGGVRIKRR